MSGLSGTKLFNSSALPSQHLWSLHVSDDFRDRLTDPVWFEDLLLALARAAHSGYRAERAKTEPGHSDNKDWEELNPKQRIDNLDPVPRRLLVLLRLGYKVEPCRADKHCVTTDPEVVEHIVSQMIEPEHRIWLSRRLAEGWEGASETRRHLRLNSDVRAFNELPESQKAINRAIIRETLAAIKPAGYRLVRANSST